MNRRTAQIVRGIIESCKSYVTSDVLTKSWVQETKDTEGKKEVIGYALWGTYVPNEETYQLFSIFFVSDTATFHLTYYSIDNGAMQASDFDTIATHIKNEIERRTSTFCNMLAHPHPPKKPKAERTNYYHPGNMSMGRGGSRS